MYYLQSRYYNPEWGRFINADSVTGRKGDLLGHNLFAYVQNNPVNMVDPYGYGPKWLEDLWEGVKSVGSFIVDVAIEVYDATNDTIIGPVSDGINKITGMNKIANKGNDALRDKATHAENVVGIGTGGSNYKIKPFIKNELMKDESTYIENAKQTYDNLLLVVNFGYKKDITGLSWDEMTEEDKSYVIDQMPIWDRQMTGNLIKYYGKDLIDISGDMLY